MTLEGDVVKRSLPSFGYASGITTGPDNNLWFTNYGGNRIGRITPAGRIDEFVVPTADSLPAGITSGPDGNIWFTEINGNRIGRITPTGEITEFPLPDPVSGPTGITAGPDGNLWFTEQSGSGVNRIGQITTTGVIAAEFPIPTGSIQPRAITTGPDGNLWFTDGRQVGRITPTGVVTLSPIPASEGLPLGITAGADGNIWFADQGSNQIGRITLPPPEIATPTATPSPRPQTPSHTPTAMPGQQNRGDGCAIAPYGGAAPRAGLGVLLTAALLLLRAFFPVRPKA
jgi:virginiamycin B lyase